MPIRKFSTFMAAVLWLWYWPCQFYAEILRITKLIWKRIMFKKFRTIVLQFPMCCEFWQWPYNILDLFLRHEATIVWGVLFWSALSSYMFISSHYLLKSYLYLVYVRKLGFFFFFFYKIVNVILSWKMTYHNKKTEFWCTARFVQYNYNQFAFLCIVLWYQTARWLATVAVGAELVLKGLICVNQTPSLFDVKGYVD